MWWKWGLWEAIWSWEWSPPDGISTFIGRDSRELTFLSFSTLWGHSEKTVVYKPGGKPSLGTKSVGTLIRPPRLQNDEKEVFVVEATPRGSFVKAAWADEDTSCAQHGLQTRPALPCDRSWLSLLTSGVCYPRSFDLTPFCNILPLPNSAHILRD